MKNFGIRIFIFCMSILMLNCLDKKQSNKEIAFQQKKLIEKVEIKYENMYTTTFVSVSCSKFENAFLKTVENKELTKDEVLRFENYLETVLKANNNEKSIDTRIKAVVYYDDKSNEEICLGLHTLELDGKIYSINNEFTKFLLKITGTE